MGERKDGIEKVQKVIYLTSIHIPLVKTSYMTTVRCKRAREYNLILCPRRRGAYGFWQVPSASVTHPISYPLTSHWPGVGQMLMNNSSTLKWNEDDWIYLCGSQTLRWSAVLPTFWYSCPCITPSPWVWVGCVTFLQRTEYSQGMWGPSFWQRWWNVTVIITLYHVI